MRLVLLPGMNGRTSLYDSLRPHFSDLLTPEWIEPEHNEPLTSYAARLAEQLKPELPFTLGGTSFGGIVAREVAGELGLDSCLLISTVRTPQELPPWWELLRPYAARGEEGLLEAGQNPPPDAPSHAVARWKRLTPPNARFLRWAATAVLNWQPSPAAQAVPTRHLHGDKDDVFPIELVSPDEIIVGGGHVLPITHPEQVRAFLQSAGASSAPVST